MIARSDSPAEDARNSPSRGENPPRTNGAGVVTRENRPGLVTALVIAGAGALLVGAAPAVGLVAADQAPAFTSWPLLLVLAASPAGVGAALLRSGRPGVASAVLVGPAMLAPGRAVLDAQLLYDASAAARPELLVPSTLDPLEPALGFWLLLAGHVAAVVAGVVAVFTNPDRSTAGRGPSAFGSANAQSANAQLPADGGDSTGAGSSGMRRQGLLGLVLCATVVAAVGVLMGQFTSDHPYILPKATLDSPALVLIGSIAVALAAPLAGGIAVSSSDPEFARGGLLGLALALAGVVVPPLVAVAVVPELHYGAGPLLGLVALLALAALSAPAGRSEVPVTSDDLRLPALARLHTAAGGLAVLGGVLAVVGALLPALEMPAGFSDTSAYPARMLWPAGLVMVLLGAGLLLRRTTSWIRPALPVAWAVLPLTTAAMLDSVFTTLTLAGASAGFGAWTAGAAVVAGIAAAVVAAIAGAVERDDVDRTEVTWRRAVIVPCALAIVLAVLAFSFPAVTAPEYQPPGLFTGFSTTSWGLVVALVAVAAACAIAPAARAARSAALLCGAAVVVLVRVLELPLTAGRVAGSGPGLGFWFGLGCLAVLAVAAVVGGRASTGSR